MRSSGRVRDGYKLSERGEVNIEIQLVTSYEHFETRMGACGVSELMPLSQR